MTEAETHPPDPTIYRVEGNRGQHSVKRWILEVLRPLVERYFQARGVVCHVGSRQYMYWVQYDPTHSLDPDLYVLPGVPQSVLIDCWKVWERGVVPSFCLHVVNTEEGDRDEDYLRVPKRYWELGVTELLVYDPFPGRNHVKFQVFRRQGDGFIRVETSDGDRVWSTELGCFVRAVREAHKTLLRLGLGPHGDELFSTA